MSSYEDDRDKIAECSDFPAVFREGADWGKEWQKSDQYKDSLEVIANALAVVRCEKARSQKLLEALTALGESVIIEEDPVKDEMIVCCRGRDVRLARKAIEEYDK